MRRKGLLMISKQLPNLLGSTIWDAVVVGAGPAGSAVAARLQRGQKNVLLVDRRNGSFQKLCGCCLSPKANAELEALSVDLAAEDIPPIPLKHCTFQTASGALQLGLSHMAVMSRERLDALLIAKAVESGVEYQGGTKINRIEWDQTSNLRLLHAELKSPQHAFRATIRSRTVIDASGLPATSRARSKHQLFASRIGIGAVLRDDHFALEPGHLKMLIAPWGYCGLVRLENNCVDIAAAVDLRILKRRSPWQAVAEIFDHTCHAPPTHLSTAAFIGKPHLTRRSPLFDQRCYRVGDAAGYVEPLTGEGIGWALRGARELAGAFEQVDLDRPDAVLQIGLRYRRGYWAATRRDFHRCRLLTLAVRNRRLWDLTMKVSRRVPALVHRIFPHATLQPSHDGRHPVLSLSDGGEP